MRLVDVSLNSQKMGKLCSTCSFRSEAKGRGAGLSQLQLFPTEVHMGWSSDLAAVTQVLLACIWAIFLRQGKS